ncbi:Gfo/Idh/MocA family protein [Leifsonia sp. 22587]|uniref:Gfo/Idh/MocA family protein n=1 Tax=Leifsonia sp. 22587 TaxID=3453946 RepID=UPI003F870A75
MKVGVLGAGRHANNALYPAIVEAGFELVAVCARSGERAQLTAQRWGATRHHTALQEMLAAGGLDGVIIAVPAGAYRPLIEQCITADVPVFCEKPAGASARELLELSALSDAASSPVVVGYMKRFAPAYQRARQLIDSIEFGTPTLAHFSFTMGRIDEYLADPRHYLIDNPVHMVDLARFFLGELSHLTARVNLVPDVGLSVSVLAKADQGATCSFDFCTTASFAHQGESAEIYGHGSAVRVENVDTCIHRPVDGPAQVWRPNYTLPAPENFGLTTMGFIPALQHFRDVAAGEAANESTLQSAARTLATMESVWAEVDAAINAGNAGSAIT